MAILKGGKWQANAYIDGKRVRPTFNTKEEAEAFERNPKAMEEVKPLVGPMFRHGFNYLWKGSRNESDAYLITEELIRRLGENTPVASITAAVLQDLVLDLRQVNSGARINRKRSALSMLLKHCYERAAITQVPVIPKKEPESQGRERFLTPAEADLLLGYLRADNRAFSLFLLHTGARIGEALALRWDAVGEDRVTFRWDTTKAKRTRIVGLNLPAREALKTVRAWGWPSPWEQIDYDTFKRDWNRAKDRAGLGSDPEVVPHILRHTHASWLVQRGVPIQTVCKLLGHSSITITMRYAKLAPDNLIGVTSVLT